MNAFSKSKKLIIAAFVATVIVVAALSIGAFYLNNTSSPEPTSTPTPSPTPMPTPPPDFNVTTSESSQTVIQGNTIQTTVNVAGFSGNQENVTLSADSGSSGILCNFSQPTGTPDFSSILTMTVPANLSTSSYSVTILATNGAVTHNASFTVSVLSEYVRVYGQVSINPSLPPTQMNFVDQQTGLPFAASVKDGQYSFLLLNGHTYKVSVTYQLMFLGGTIDSPTNLNVHAQVGQTSMSQDYLFTK